MLDHEAVVLTPEVAILNQILSDGEKKQVGLAE